MTTGYQINKQDGTYFLTWTVIGWVDLFIRDTYKQLIADSLNFCMAKHKLQIYAYVIMPSHIHPIANSKNNNLSTVTGHFKSYTSRELIKLIKSPGESRREWLLPVFRSAGQLNSRNINNQIWQQQNHAVEVYSSKFTLSKINYIHNNPVEAGMVQYPHEYLYSSARDYAGNSSPVKITQIELHSLFYS